MSTKQKASTLDKNGSEIVDSKPMEIPIGFRRPPSLQEQIQRFVRNELSEQAHADGKETFEESEYFGEDDRDEPSSPHELHYDSTTGREVTQEELKHIRDGEREFDKNWKAYQQQIAKEKKEIADYRRKRRKAALARMKKKQTDR